jgi:hypothetical protein
MLVLLIIGFLKPLTVRRPFSKGNVLFGCVAILPHWTGVLWENGTKTKWAVDSWIYENGENPAVIEADKWELKDLESLPPAQT